MLKLHHRRAAQGVTLIEMMIALVVLGILIMIGLPSMGHWIQNTQIRTTTESVFAGLQLARAEALKRNDGVRFQLVDSLTSGCVLTTLGKAWVVSITSPAGVCHDDASETAGSKIIQKGNGAEGAANTQVSSTVSLLTFTGLGRVSGSATATINVSNTAGGACGGAPGQMRCLRIVIGGGGQMRMCDPAVTDATDPRKCP